LLATHGAQLGLDLVRRRARGALALFQALVGPAHLLIGAAARVIERRRRQVDRTVQHHLEDAVVAVHMAEQVQRAEPRVDQRRLHEGLRAAGHVGVTLAAQLLVEQRGELVLVAAAAFPGIAGALALLPGVERLLHARALHRRGRVLVLRQRHVERLEFLAARVEGEGGSLLPLVEAHQRARSWHGGSPFDGSWIN
jgi:hypothetical protein